ncbi:phosphomannomutase/phosphoglucomutase [Kineosporia sp. A_224]|uniref:phosphomannomutase/phosphoglucomutase n=1 Tax=Kineosporia sp. A_224 TaxID=1962180 RepID=UPI000B4A5C82|nr:phosphomannomutase/phosphoglucomutase [Kineosporia sp. A_224]
MRSLENVVKAYDVRGLVGPDLDAEVTQALGVAFAEVVVLAETTGERPKAVVGHDMRPSSPELSRAFADGLASCGVDVTLIGLASTDGLYYASGALDAPGAMFTASHNPAAYNGIKLCRAGARPVSQDTGLRAVRERAEALLNDPDAARAAADEAAARTPGAVHEADMLRGYAEHLRGLVDLSGSRPLKVVVDAGNGMGGLTTPAVLGEAAGLPALPLEIVPLYFELDGTFPNHEANPLEPANLRDLQAKVVEVGADIGLAFDGDADRCFVIDERGDPVSPSAVTALVARREIGKERAAGREATVIHNLITSHAVPEIIAESGGKGIRTRVGHSFIKAEMAAADAVFGGEHSAHYYFRDFWFADTGMLAAMHVLAALGEQDGPLSVLGADYERYVASGEINSRVDDVVAAAARVEAAFGSRDGVEVDRLDGLTVTHAGAPMWWFNLRPSNTEPLLRLNAEAVDTPTMAALRDEVLGIVRQG